MREELRNDRGLLDVSDDLQLPAERAQASISIPNTRFSRLAQLIARWRGVIGLSGLPA